MHAANGFTGMVASAAVLGIAVKLTSAFIIHNAWPDWQSERVPKPVCVPVCACVYVCVCRVHM